jgi:hypothetical protein
LDGDGERRLSFVIFPVSPTIDGTHATTTELKPSAQAVVHQEAPVNKGGDEIW